MVLVETPLSASVECHPILYMEKCLSLKQFSWRDTEMGDPQNAAVRDNTC